MVKWLNRAVFQLPRNGTTTHTVDPTSATGLVVGATFTPTAGSLLLAIVQSPGTSTLPASWANGGSTAGATAIYQWVRVAIAGSNSFSVTHNGSNYPMMVAIYEFPAESAYVRGTGATLTNGATSPHPSFTSPGLAPFTRFAVKGKLLTGAHGGPNFTWTANTGATPTEDFDLGDSFTTTDGYTSSLAYVEDLTTTQWIPTGSSSVAGDYQATNFDIYVHDGSPIVTLRAAGVPTGATAAVTAVNPAVPAGTTTGDLSVLSVEVKPNTATITTPTGWTKIGEQSNGGVAAAADVGSMKVAVFVRESAPVGAIGAIAQTGANSMGAVINTYVKPATHTWDYSGFWSALDTTNAINFSATGSGTEGVPGDFLVASVAVNSDAGTIVAPGINNGTAAGSTYTTLVTNQVVTTGFDSRLLVAHRFNTIDISTTSGGVGFSYTNSSASSGSAILLRLRTIPPASGPPAGTASGAYVFAGGTATGSAPASSTKSGTASGAYTYAPTVTGRTTKRGTGTGTYTWTGTATGKATKRGSATGAYTWSGTATGVQPAVGAKSGTASGTYTFAGATTGRTTKRGTAVGAFTWSGTATGTATKRGTATGTYLFAGSPATGKRTPKGQSAGAYTFNGSATGFRPIVGAKTGTASGTYTFAPTVTGRTTKRGTASGSYTYAPTVTGRTTKRGTASGTYTYAPTVVGRTTKRGTAAGAFTWTGSATGVAPVVGAKSGTASGSYTYTGTVTGKRTPKGSASGAYTYIGAAVGKRAPRGTATGSYTYTPTVVGRTTKRGLSTGAYSFNGTANGFAPIVGAKTGTASGSWTYSGTAIGRKTSRGTASGSFVYTGLVIGRRVARGSASGAYLYTATTIGRFIARGSAGGAYLYDGLAVGEEPGALPDLPEVRTLVGYAFRAALDMSDSPATLIGSAPRATLQGSRPEGILVGASPNRTLRGASA